MFRFATTQWAGFGGRCLSMTGSSLCPSGEAAPIYISCICHSSSFLQDKWFWLCLRPKDQGEEHVQKITIYGRSGDWRSHSISSRRGWLGCTLQVICLLSKPVENTFEKSIEVKCQAWQNSLRGSNRTAPQLMARGEFCSSYCLKSNCQRWNGGDSLGAEVLHTTTSAELQSCQKYSGS